MNQFDLPAPSTSFYTDADADTDFNHNRTPSLPSLAPGWPVSHPLLSMEQQTGSIKHHHESAHTPRQLVSYEHPASYPRSAFNLDWHYPMSQPTQRNTTLSFASGHAYPPHYLSQCAGQLQQSSLDMMRHNLPSPTVFSLEIAAQHPLCQYDSSGQPYETWQTCQPDMNHPINRCANGAISTAGFMPHSLDGISLPNAWSEPSSLASIDNPWQEYLSSRADSHAFLHDQRTDFVPSVISNAALLLHTRTDSHSSMDDCSPRTNYDSHDELQFNAASPEAEVNFDSMPQGLQDSMASFHDINLAQTPTSTSDVLFSSPSVTTSPRWTLEIEEVAQPVKKGPAFKVTAASARKKAATAAKKECADKRVGRRTGPLNPEQRRSAGVIRKIKACLRCKFLKKTCGPGEPCTGCKPSHARLWQVPCTRMDIRDIGNFIEDWHADCNAASVITPGVIESYSTYEHNMLITHGYKHKLAIRAREVAVSDQLRMDVSWIESDSAHPKEFTKTTAKLAVGEAGIDPKLLEGYVDAHLDDGFEDFIDQHFAGTEFLTERLKSAYHYYRRTKSPVVRKALKLVIAYNLTLQITLIDAKDLDMKIPGRIYERDSKYHGKVAAPLIINYAIKQAMSALWRRLHKDVLNELSSLYQCVYTGQKFKHWPTIFMLTLVLLGVWEEMQFDIHYRSSDDPVLVGEFCNAMEKIPVGVVVGLFSTISQKIPLFTEWNSRKNHNILDLDVNDAICEALSEFREHVIRYNDYLHTRADCYFDPNDYDCLANKFVAKVVLRTGSPVRE